MKSTLIFPMVGGILRRYVFVVSFREIFAVGRKVLELFGPPWWMGTSI